MQIKIFSVTPEKKFFGPEFAPSTLENMINEWLSAHPKIRVHHAKHDVVAAFFVAPMMIVSLYYTLERAGFGSGLGLGGEASALDALEIETLAEE